MHTLRWFAGVGLILLVSVVSLAQNKAQGSPLSAATQNGPLQLTLAQELNSSRPLFRLEFHNTGNQFLVLDLGFGFPLGNRQYPDAIQLILTDMQGKNLSLKLKGPGLVGGRPFQLVIPLPEEAAYSFLIDLKNYYAPDKKIWNLHLPPGRYLLKAEYRAHEPQDPFSAQREPYPPPNWNGQVDSNDLTFTLDHPMPDSAP